jgi:hypothetical protein
MVKLNTGFKVAVFLQLAQTETNENDEGMSKIRYGSTGRAGRITFCAA